MRKIDEIRKILLENEYYGGRHANGIPLKNVDKQYQKIKEENKELSLEEFIKICKLKLDKTYSDKNSDCYKFDEDDNDYNLSITESVLTNNIKALRQAMLKDFAGPKDLINAIKRKNKEIVELLLENSDAFSKIDKYCENIFILAIESLDIEIINMIGELYPTFDDYVCKAAFKTNNLEIVETVFSLFEDDKEEMLEGLKDEGINLFYNVIKYSNDVDILKEVIKLNIVDPTIGDLETAVEQNKIEFVKELLLFLNKKDEMVRIKQDYYKKYNIPTDELIQYYENTAKNIIKIANNIGNKEMIKLLTSKIL